MKVVSCLALFLAASSAFAVSSPERIHTGPKPQFVPHAVSASPSIQGSDYSRYQISLVLEAERRMSTVQDAMAIKRTGLVYVEDLQDFEYLASFTVSSPSDAYRQAVAEFVVGEVSPFVRTSVDLQTLARLEQLTLTVDQAMAVKKIGLNVVSSIFDFRVLIPFSVTNPSDSYRQAVAAFVASTIGQVVGPYSPIALIIEIERYTQTIDQAMAVKNAGLIAVHSKAQLLELAQYSVPNPSPGFVAAVNAFIVANLSRYP